MPGAFNRSDIEESSKKVIKYSLCEDHPIFCVCLLAECGDCKEFR